MIDLRLAMRLKRAGLAWHPRPGDRFAVPQPDLLGQVFTLSDMTIEVHQRATGPILGFNGTTEWALDSVQADEVVWLPAEHQLRELLGPAFLGLQADGGDGDVAPGGDGDAVPGGDGDVALDGDGDAVPGGPESPATTGSASDEPPTRGFRVLAEIPGYGSRAFRAPVAEDAYALALLALIGRATG